MTSEPQHITVCVCTYKRPRLLKRLLDEVGRQESDGRFTYSIVVADNDHLQSGKEVVSNFAAASKVRVQYCVEARQNIALARNKAVENATGDFVAFIEDDEFFRRMIDKGHKFIWCGEAVVYEVVPPIRWKRTFMLRRALLRGTVSVLQPTFGAVDIAKALVAIPAYTVALPVALVLGHHRFLALLVRLCDRLGSLLSALGLM